MTKQARQFLSFGALFLAVSLLFSALFRTAAEGIFSRSAGSVREPSGETVIILDAGHGGEDGGATGTNGVLEKDLNLQVTGDLATLLRLAGYEVVQTRTEDKLLYDAGTKKGHKKQGDLTNRLAVTRQYENCIFISIHMNTFPDQRCEGTQVWYSQNDPASLELASAIQNSVKELLQPHNHRKVKAATSGIYLLRHAEVPAVLIECGFLSTPADCERLCDPVYQKELTLALFAAICEKIET